MPTDRLGQIVSPAPVPGPAPLRPYREGEAYRDPEDKITYRVLGKALPEDGWATGEFWQKRWRIDYDAVLELARAGLLDPVIVYGSSVRRFRCRDERVVRGSELFARLRNRTSGRIGEAKRRARKTLD